MLVCVCVCVCVLSHPVIPDFLQPHGLQPTRFLCPWDFPGKNTGVGCLHFFRGSSHLVIEPKSPSLAGVFFTTEQTGNLLITLLTVFKTFHMHQLQMRLFSPLYRQILVSITIASLTISVQIYLWDFYLVPLIYKSVLFSFYSVHHIFNFFF